MALHYVGTSNSLATNGAQPAAIEPHVDAADGDLHLFLHYSHTIGVPNESVSVPGFTTLTNSNPGSRGFLWTAYRYQQPGDPWPQATLTNHTSSNLNGEAVLERLITFRDVGSIVHTGASNWPASRDLGPINNIGSLTLPNAGFVLVIGGRLGSLFSVDTLGADDVQSDGLTWLGIGFGSTTLGLKGAFVQQLGENLTGTTVTPTSKTIYNGLDADVLAAQGQGEMIFIRPPASAGIDVNSALETDTALPMVVSIDQFIDIGQAHEIDEAPSIDAPGDQSIALDQAQETDTALGIAPSPENTTYVDMGLATEKDQALPIIPSDASQDPLPRRRRIEGVGRSFDIWIDDIDGYPITRVDNYSDCEVNIPLNDLRTASFRISLFDPAVRNVGDGHDRTVRIRYKGHLVMRGLIEDPEYDAEAAVCTVNVVDPATKLIHAFHRYGDAVVADPTYSETGTETEPVLGDGHSYTWDGDGAFLLLDSALNTAHPGIVKGRNTVPPTNFVRRAERGSMVWDTITEMMTSTNGFDVEMQPIDKWEDPDGLYAAAGGDGSAIYCQMNCWEDQGAPVDRARAKVFEKGMNTDNVANIVYQPRSSMQINDVVVTPPAGERGFNDPSQKGRATDHGSGAIYGTWQRWETAQENDDKADWIEKARAYVEIFAHTPRGFTITTNLARSGPETVTDPPTYPNDFELGDIVKVNVRVGYLDQNDILGRVMRVTLRQADQNSSTQQEIEAIPPNTDLGDVET